MGDDESVWVGQSLGYHEGDRVALLINDRERDYVVRGVFPDDGGNAAAIVMDLAAAQRAVGRIGHVDRILVKVPEKDDGGSRHVASEAEWQQRSWLRIASGDGAELALAAILPEGVELRVAGTGTEENRKMLAAFRWNLKLLSYIALVVGAFLIYNTISVSVVRRRAEIGIVRALGASRATVLAAFIGEAASFGLIGSLIGLPLGRVMASGAVKLMSATVEALYVSSRPGRDCTRRGVGSGRVDCGSWSCGGVGVCAGARSIARCAVEAMARGRREYVAKVHKLRDLAIAAAACARRVFCFACAGRRGQAAVRISRDSARDRGVCTGYSGGGRFHDAALTRALGATLGVEASLASQSLSASLRRTSVLVGALSTAIAMMTAVGIMVGSFRETVLLWMNDQVPADLYMRAGGVPGSGPASEPDSRVGRQNCAAAWSRNSGSTARLRNQLRRDARWTRIGRARCATRVSQG